MDELNKWLASDKNYFVGLDLLLKYNPSHELIEDLQKEASFINRILLEEIIKNFIEENKGKVIKTKSSKARKAKALSTELEEKKVLTDEDFHRIAEKELATTYIKRRKLSNQLRQGETDEERASISDKIKDCIQAIGSFKARIKVYKETGVMPPKPTIEAHSIPKSDLDLERAINNYRSKISHQKSLIKNYDDQPRRKSKAQHQYKLLELEKHLQKLTDERDLRNG